MLDGGIIFVLLVTLTLTVFAIGVGIFYLDRRRKKKQRQREEMVAALTAPVLTNRVGGERAVELAVRYA